jgi:hypothetical protein
VDRAFVIAPALGYARKFLQSFEAYPPRQKPESWNLDAIVKNLETATQRD